MAPLRRREGGRVSSLDDVLPGWNSPLCGQTRHRQGHWQGRRPAPATGSFPDFMEFPSAACGRRDGREGRSHVPQQRHAAGRAPLHPRCTWRCTGIPARDRDCPPMGRRQGADGWPLCATAGRPRLRRPRFRRGLSGRERRGATLLGRSLPARRGRDQRRQLPDHASGGRSGPHRRAGHLHRRGHVAYSAATDHPVEAVATVSAVDIGSLLRDRLGRTRDPAAFREVVARARQLRTEEPLGVPAREHILPEEVDESPLPMSAKDMTTTAPLVAGILVRRTRGSYAARTG